MKAADKCSKTGFIMFKNKSNAILIRREPGLYFLIFLLKLSQL